MTTKVRPRSTRDEMTSQRDASVKVHTTRFWLLVPKRDTMRPDFHLTHAHVPIKTVHAPEQDRKHVGSSVALLMQMLRDEKKGENMKIREMYDRRKPVISFEFFPPKTNNGVTNLFKTIDTLRAYHPSYVSVTYGAGGSTRDKTVDLVRRMKNDIGIEAMSHLSCVGATQADIDSILDDLAAADIDNILALGGDPPRDQPIVDRSVWGFQHANELAAHIKTRQRFCVGGACYPEGHIDAPSKDIDLKYCKQKVDDGAEFLITQLFFDNRDYFDFVERARAIGIEVPIVPGIMPVTNFTQIKRFADLCGATIPQRMILDMAPIEEDLDKVEASGIAYATQQCRELLDAGVPGFHFYTLNKSRALSQILDNLKLG